MSRDGMPRAYLRIDPNIDQHPDPLSMVRAMCAAARQPERGRFREPAVLERAVGRRQYRAMVERGDVIKADPGPGVYLDGWDEWQEGDLTVGERMRRMRDRRKRNRVTAPPSPDRNVVTTDAGTSRSSSRDEGDGVGVFPPNPPPSGGLRATGRSPRQLAAKEREAEEKRAHERRLAATKKLIVEYQQ